MATSKNGSIRKRRNLIIIGDGMCGKTSLLFAFKDNRFIPTHNPTVSNTYTADVQVGGKTVSSFCFKYNLDKISCC
jgi:GTPase SAR1 family protein